MLRLLRVLAAKEGWTDATLLILLGDWLDQSGRDVQTAMWASVMERVDAEREEETET